MITQWLPRRHVTLGFSRAPQEPQLQQPSFLPVLEAIPRALPATCNSVGAALNGFCHLLRRRIAIVQPNTSQIPTKAPPKFRSDDSKVPRCRITRSLQPLVFPFFFRWFSSSSVWPAVRISILVTPLLFGKPRSVLAMGEMAVHLWERKGGYLCSSLPRKMFVVFSISPLLVVSRFLAFWARVLPVLAFSGAGGWIEVGSQR